MDIFKTIHETLGEIADMSDEEVAKVARDIIMKRDILDGPNVIEMVIEMTNYKFDKEKFNNWEKELEKIKIA